MTLLLCLSDSVQVEGAGAAPFPLAPRDAALLAWLALEGPTSRDQMAALLWPSSTAAQARNALRQRLFKLKKALGEDVVTSSPLLALSDGVHHDLNDAVELLGQMNFPDAPDFDAWLTSQRQRRAQREADGLRAQAEALEASGEAAAALPVAHALLRREPLSEVAHQRVIRLLYLSGDRAAALAAFDACEQLLKHELGAQPSRETLALLATVERSEMPLQAGQHRALPAAVLRPPRLVGRDREVAALARAWATAQVAGVIGEAGMGKTRLLAEFMDAQTGIVRAAGRPGDAGVPFASLARLLRAIEGQPAVFLSAEARQQLAPVLPEIGGPCSTFPEGQRLQLQRAMLAFVQAAPGLTGLVLDDLHFADQASLEMLQSLIVEARQVRWALAWRPAEAGSPVNALEVALIEAAMLTPVVVAPLDEAALAQLVDDLQLGVDGGTLAPLLLQRTGGNPLFVLETLKQAWVDGSIVDLTAGGDLPVPLSVGQLMERRVSQLSAPALALARVAGIAGVDFSLDLAEQVLGTPAMSLVSALNELEGAQVLKGLQFAHDLVFDAVLASVPQTVAEHTHARTALFLEQRQAEPARVAEHWLAAKQPLNALPCLTAAAISAKRAGRGREQAEFLLRAAAVEEGFGTPDAAFDLAIQVLQDELHSFLADPMSVAALLQRLARTDRQRALAHGAQAWRLNRDWRQDEARVHALQSLQFAERCGETALINDAWHQLAVIDAMSGNNERALPWFEKVAASLLASGDEAPDDFHANYAMTLDNLGRVAQAWSAWRSVLEEERRSGRVTPITLANAAINRQYAGHSEAANRLVLESLAAHARDETSPAERVSATLSLARSEQLLGRWQSALALLDGLDPAVVAHTKFYVASQRLRRCENWIELGQFARAFGELAALGNHLETYYKFSVTAWCELARARRWAGQPSSDCLEKASALRPPGSASDLRLRIQLEGLHSRPANDVLAGTEPVLSEAQALGLDGIVMTAWWVRAARLREAAPEQAAVAAEHALQLAPVTDMPGLYKPELWWHAALALQRVGDADRAAAVARRAAAWINERVEQGDVPPEFIDSFLHRNPVNRELLAWAGRLQAEVRVTRT